MAQAQARTTVQNSIWSQRIRFCRSAVSWRNTTYCRLWAVSTYQYHWDVCLTAELLLIARIVACCGDITTAMKALRSRRAKLFPGSGALPCYKGPGHGGARPGAGRPKLGQLKSKARKRSAKTSHAQASPARWAHSGKCRPRVRPRGPLTLSEVQQCLNNRVYKELIDARQQISASADYVLAAQVALLYIELFLDFYMTQGCNSAAYSGKTAYNWGPLLTACSTSVFRQPYLRSSCAADNRLKFRGSSGLLLASQRLPDLGELGHLDPAG